MSEDTDQQEDEQGEPQEEQKKKTWFGFFIKIAISISLFLAVIFIVLANMGGNSDSLKQAIEGFVSSSTGYHARIETLNQMSFFPIVRFDFEGLVLYQDEREGMVVASAEAINTAIGFWDTTFQTGKMYVFDVKGLRVKPGVVLEKGIHLESLGIMHPEGEEARLEAKGSIAETAFSGSMQLEALDNGNYMFPSERSVTLSLGASKLQAQMAGKIGYHFGFKDMALSHNEVPVLTGEVFVGGNNGQWVFDGDATLKPHESAVQFDVSYEGKDPLKVITGDVNAKSLNPKDIGDDAPIRQWIDEMNNIFGSNESGDDFDALADLDLDLNVNIDALKLEGRPLGKVSIPLKIKDQVLQVENGSGQISGGALTYDVNLNSAEQMATFKTSVSLKNMNFGALQKGLLENEEVTGAADIALYITGQGSSWNAVLESLNGTMRFISGEGEMRSGAVNIWGGGLLNALLPSLNPEENLIVNCSVLDFNIEDGVAKSNAMFIDMKRLTLNGEGRYNIAADDLDIKLKPKTKDIAIGDIASGILIKGPISNPSIQPSLIDLGAKIGGFLLGAINPAFYALSLADLGLTENHPCSEFLENQNQQPE